MALSSTLQTPCDVSRYFPNGIPLDSTSLASQLQHDLTLRVEAIYQAVKTGNFSSSTSILLQKTNNRLRASIEQICLSGAPFFKKSGQCFGACKWFIALLLHFKEKYPNIPTHNVLVEIAKEFADGVGIEAAFLQKKFQDSEEHANLLKTILKLDIENLETIDRQKNKNLSAEILKTALGLADGIYYFSFSGCPPTDKYSIGKLKTEPAIPGHATVVIVEKGNYYFFDPNEGLTGTGCTIGTDDKEADACFLLGLCHQYSPAHRAFACFAEGLQSITKQLVGEKFAQRAEMIILEEAFLVFEKDGRAVPCAGEFFSLMKNCEKIRKCPISDEEETAFFDALLYKPAMMLLRLQDAEAIRIKKISLDLSS